MEYEKVYVETLVRFTVEGRLIPAAIVWENGTEFAIDRVVSERKAPPRHVGAYATVLYEIRVGGKLRELYFETAESKWFVERGAGR